MLWDALLSGFVVITLAAAFGAVPLSGVLRALRRPHPSARGDASRAAPVAGAGARIIPFPASAPALVEADDDPVLEARRA